MNAVIWKFPVAPQPLVEIEMPAPAPVTSPRWVGMVRAVRIEYATFAAMAFSDDEIAFRLKCGGFTHRFPISVDHDVVSGARLYRQLESGPVVVHDCKTGRPVP